MIIRNDDVNANSNFREMDAMYGLLRSVISPTPEIWSCVNMFSKQNEKGAVHPGIPLKEQPLPYFFEVDQRINLNDIAQFDSGIIVSHGLWHFDHTDASMDLQEASIVTSCQLLFTNVFVPPFNKWDARMEHICIERGIRLVKPSEGWKSFEHNKFDVTHPLWYFHSWKWTPDKLREYLCA